MPKICRVVRLTLRSFGQNVVVLGLALPASSLFKAATCASCAAVVPCCDSLSLMHSLFSFWLSSPVLTSWQPPEMTEQEAEAHIQRLILLRSSTWQGWRPFRTLSLGARCPDGTASHSPRTAYGIKSERLQLHHSKKRAEERRRASLQPTGRSTLELDEEAPTADSDPPSERRGILLQLRSSSCVPATANCNRTFACGIPRIRAETQQGSWTLDVAPQRKLRVCL